MAIAGRLVVSSEQLTAQSGAVKGQLDSMKSHFETIKNKLNSSSSFWKGDAGDAHRRKYTEQQKTIEEMFRRYEEQIRDLNEMAGVYQRAETQATGAAEGLPASTL